MDPIAHTLFGAALAEAGLKRVARGATAALVIGANLPDLDVLAYLHGADYALGARRGWTHGVLAMVVLPLLLTAVLLAWQRWRPRATVPPQAPPANPMALLGVACLAVWSHPLLDWLNTYGVRLLMPFDGRWWYGDTLFIIDPWVWLLLAAGVVLARSTRWPAIVAWLTLAALGTRLVASGGLPVGVLLGWCLGVAAIVAMRWRLPVELAPRVAAAGLVLVIAHGASAYGLARAAESAAATRFPGAEAVQANPMPGLPFAHRVVVAHADRYRILDADGEVRELPRTPADAVVQRALADPSIRGFTTWMRFPWWQAEAFGRDTRVRLYDLRYAEPGQPFRGIGYAEVIVSGSGPEQDPQHE